MIRPETVEKVDSMSIKILEVLDSHGGTATTTEIKNALGHDSNDYVNYRKRAHLEPTGLIDTFQPESTTERNIPTLEWSLTEKGLEFLEEYAEDSGAHRDLGERVELIEDQLDGMQETLVEIQEDGGQSDSETDEKILSLIQTVEDLEGEIGGLHEQVNGLDTRVKEIESSPLFDEDIQEKLDVAIIMAAVSKHYFIEEYGREEVRDLFVEKDEENLSLLD
jgi:DNA-binding PadR family transcriptional regulator